VFQIRLVNVAESFDSNRADWIMVATMYGRQHQNYVKESCESVRRGQDEAPLHQYSVGDWGLTRKLDQVVSSQSVRRPKTFDFSGLIICNN